MKRSLLTLLFFAGILIAGNFIAFKLVHVPDQKQFVVIIALLLFYPILRKPIVGIYSLFILIPFVPFMRRLYYLAYSRPEADPLIIIGDIIMVVMLLGLFFVFRDHLQRGTFRYRIAFIVLVYFLYMVLRVFVYNELPTKMALLRFRFFGPSVLLFFVGMIYAFEDKHIKTLWKVTLIIAVLSVLYGLKQFFFGYIEAEKIWFSSIDFSSLFIKGLARPFSFFQAPASFADYMQIAVIGLIAYAGWSKIGGKIVWVLLPLFWAGTLVTSVRSNWVGMALSLFVWFIIVRAKGPRQRILYVGGMVAAFLLFDVVQTVIQTGAGLGSLVATASGSSQASENIAMLVTERAGAIANPFQEHSFLYRLELWWYVIQSSFDPQWAIFGRGIGVLDADSLYITYLAQFGYPGMLLIVAIIIIFIKNGFHVLDKSKSAYTIALARAVLTMDIVFAIISLTGSHIHSFPGDTYFWFWNGVLMGQWTEREGTEKPDESAVDA